MLKRSVGLTRLRPQKFPFLASRMSTKQTLGEEAVRELELEYKPAPRLPNGTFAAPDHWNYKQSGLTDVMKWKLTETNVSNVPSASELDKTLPILKPTFSQKIDPADCRVSWLGHSAVLLEMNGLTVLTDPVFASRASPVQFAGPKRYRDAPLEVSELPHIDAILISHNHYDHLDLITLKEICQVQPHVRWYIPLKNKQFLTSVGIPDSTIHELDWWGESKLKEYSIHCVPVQHWSARGVFDRNVSLWGGFVVQGNGGSFFFCGDTGYSPVFKSIGHKFGRQSISAIPIGAYEPRWMMAPQHVDPAEAVQIHHDVKSACSLGIHWGTFVLTDEFYLEPRDRLNELMAAEKKDEFFALDHGGQKVCRWVLE